MESKYSSFTRTRGERREGESLQKEESSTKNCCKSQENEQLRVLGDLKKRHFQHPTEM